MSLKENNLPLINKQLDSMLANESNMIANMANASSLLYNSLEDLNWVGFYLFQDQQLILGPFQGMPACTRIPLGQGVCGNAAQDREIYLVADVHKFSGHIACDQASESEIVLPIIVGDRLVAVLDIDSPQKNRFNKNDQKDLEEFIKILIKRTDFKF